MRTRGKGDALQEDRSVPLRPAAQAQYKERTSEAQEIEFSSILAQSGISGQLMQDLGSSVIKSNMGRFSWLSWDYFRYYFRVNHSYVFNKIKSVFLPCFQKQWRPQINQEGEPAPPVLDVNAPDLYLPLMSIMTYTLLQAFICARISQFSPEVLGIIWTSVFAVVILENMLLNFCYFVLSVPTTPHMLDTLAFSCYKFIPVNFTVFISIFLIPQLQWIVGVVTGICVGMFMARTLQRVFVTVDGSTNTTAAFKSKKNTFLLVAGIAQVPLCLYLEQSFYYT